MSALPRPDIPPGPHRELVDALHDLHHRAGWPSLRRMAVGAGTSHTTVSKAFSSPSVPAWGILELLVETLGGDVDTFHELWLRASASPEDPPPATRSAIAGRRAELAAVRAHLEGGTGLLLVAGEAGIGKTRLVSTAAEGVDVTVAAGHALPLSTQAPLMPVGEALRAIHDADDGRTLEAALAAAPRYVRETLGRLVPEVTTEGAAPESPDDFSRQRLFAAVSRCLSGVRALGGLGLLLEDLHWADTATLDLLEHVVSAGLDVPIVATWRLDDPDTGDAQRDWWLRVRRLSGVRVLELSPLTREESGEQCRLLGLEADDRSLDRIHGRSGGHPLFTEQLAVHARDDTALPAMLADLLDRRLERLDGSPYAIARALGVADRELAPRTLAAVTGLGEVALVDGVRELVRAHVLAPTDPSGDVRLRHPLLAEAARRRLVAGEAASVHRRLAEVLGAESEPSPAEVAEHWRGAGDRDRELEWRIAAARAAEAQWAARQAAEHWLRALEVWPDAPARAGAPPLTRPEAYLAAMDALKDSLQFDRAAEMSASATTRFPDLEPELRAEFLRRASVFRTDLDGPEVGLELAEEAIAILSELPLGVGLVRAMARRHQILVRMGRYAESVGGARETAAAAEAVGDRLTQRLMLGHVAWYEAVMDGDLDRGAATVAAARSVSTAAEDPEGQIWLATIWTDALLVLGADATEVVAAGRDALAVADEHGIENFGPLLVRYNVTRALIDGGRLTEAATLLGPEAQDEVDADRVPIFMARALLEALDGRLDDASETIDRLCELVARPIQDLEFAAVMAVVDLWRGRPRAAWSRLAPALEGQVDSWPPAALLPGLVLAARAVADLAAAGAADVQRLRAELASLHQRAHSDRSSSTWSTRDALAATWAAELARTEAADSTHVWQVAGSAWSGLGRPHDAAYCLWRAGQAANREGQGTVAARLLARAASQARGHEPLRSEIEAMQARPSGAVSR